MLRSFVKSIITKGLSLLLHRRHGDGDHHDVQIKYFNDNQATTSGVPDDDDDEVMEGYFTVLAMKGKEKRRFSVELDCLSDPAFLGLLEQAKEEYGFRHQGALAVPCRPQDLQKILEGRRRLSSSF